MNLYIKWNEKIQYTAQHSQVKHVQLSPCVDERDNFFRAFINQLLFTDFLSIKGMFYDFNNLLFHNAPCFQMLSLEKEKTSQQFSRIQLGYIKC